MSEENWLAAGTGAGRLGGMSSPQTSIPKKIPKASTSAGSKASPVSKTGSRLKSELPTNRDQAKAAVKPENNPPVSDAVDRPGFDLGGSTGKTSAGTGLGLGTDAAEDHRDRSLPGRCGKRI